MAGVSLQSVEKARRVIRGCGPLYSIRLWRHKVKCPAGAREGPLGGAQQKIWNPRGLHTLRVLPPGGTPQLVSSSPFPGAEPHVLCMAKLEKVAFSHFFDNLCFPLIIGITL